MDETLTHWLNLAAGQNLAFDTAVVILTKFGVPLMALCVAAQWWATKDRTHVRHAAVAAGLSFVLGLAFNQLLLVFVHRKRPYDAGLTHLIIPPSADWSFPSDHATVAFAVVVAFALQSLPWRSVLFLVVALLIAWSRVFVGTHYVSDVLGGACTGALAALVVRLAYREGSRIDCLVTGIL
jgi:undecaprenyl-diphosphatase